VYDLLIENGTAVTPEWERELDVAVEGERITAIGRPGSFAGQARIVLDARGCLVLPGGIDPHVHYAMNFEHILTTEGPEYSFAAALGGNTTVIDFVFQEPPSSLHEAIDARKSEFSGRMAVDYGLHAILTKGFSYDVVEEIGDVIRDGIPTIKTMMTYGYMSDDGQRYGAMCEVAEHGGMSLVHAEDDAIARWLTGKYLREGKTHGAYICEVRGPIVEEAAIRRALFLAERSGSPLYVLHMAAGSGIDALAEARAKRLPMYGETVLAYLSFTQADLWDDSPVEAGGKVYPNRGALFNNYPTPKFAEDRDACWQAIADGRLQAVATDHALVRLRDRFEIMSTTIDNMQAGQAAVELRLPVLYSAGVGSGRISRRRFVELVSTNPAKVMGLWPNKGQLAEGADADIVVFDPRARWTVRWQDLHMSEPYSCWDGWELTGKVRDTVLRGSILVRNGEFVGSRTGGEFHPRSLLAEVVGGSPDFGYTFLASDGADFG
jgi:dihydropyrimidinase